MGIETAGKVGQIDDPELTLTNSQNNTRESTETCL